jgi:tetratricopeptide (TPR) repeat protein
MTPRSAPAVTLEPGERQRLEALGYLMGDSTPAPAATDRTLRDIKEMLPVKNRDSWLRAQIHKGTLRESEVTEIARSLVQRSPETAAFRHRLANALLKEGELEAAVAELEEALRLRPEFTEARNSLGNALLRQGKVEEGMYHFSEALRLAPDFAEAHLGMGNAAAARGDLEAARRHYGEAIRLQPDYAEAHLNLANTLVRRGEKGDAVTHYERALQIKPDLAIAHHNLALLLAERDDLDEAIGHYREAIRLSPDFAGAHYNLAIVLEREGKLGEAKTQYAEAVRLDPDEPQFANSLAWLLATSPDDSVRDAERAVEVALEACRLTGFTAPRMFNTLAAAYAEAGQFEDAVLAATAAIDLARRKGWSEAVEEFEAKRQLYADGRPFRRRAGEAASGSAAKPGKSALDAR